MAGEIIYTYGEGSKAPSSAISHPQEASLIQVKEDDVTPLNSLVAVIPVYNNDATIGSVIVQTLRYVDRVIVVDDGSADKSSEIAQLAGAEVVRLNIHIGKTYALLLGLKSAWELGCKAVVMLDADGYHQIHDIPKIAAQALSGDADLVIGSHYVEKKGEVPFPQKFKSMTLLKSEKKENKQPITDPQSNFRAFSRKALENLDFKTDGYNIESDIITHFLSLGLVVHEIQLTNLSSPPSDSNWGNPVKVLAAMPAYNEEKYIAKMIVGTKKYVDQVLIVDDGSTDATREIAEGLGAIVVRHEKNAGYGAALKTIFTKARQLHVEALVILDADGQHNPEDVGWLLETLVTDDADIVIGSRFKDGNGRHIPGYRKVGMKVLDGATKVAGVAEVNDSQSGFRAYGKRAINVINPSCEGMSAGSEILIQASDRKLRIAEVPIDVRYDIENTSTIHPLKHGVSVLSKIIALISYRRPLPAFGIPGFILFIIGMVAASFAFTEYYQTTKFPFTLSMMSAMFIIIGLLMVVAGLILNAMIVIVREGQRKI